MKVSVHKGTRYITSYSQT